MAKRDYVESVKSKAFILGLIVAPLLFGGGFLGIAIIKKRPDLKDRHISILDHTGVAAPLIVQAAKEKNEKEKEKGSIEERVNRGICRPTNTIYQT